MATSGSTVEDPQMDQKLKTSDVEKGVVTLCGVQGCCPTVDFTSPDEVVLRDDHGGTVKLTRAEWAELKQTFAQPTQG